MNFDKCMMRMVDTSAKQMALIQQTIKYKDRIDYFGMPLAVDSSLTMDPGIIIVIVINHHFNWAIVLV